MKLMTLSISLLVIELKQNCSYFSFVNSSDSDGHMNHFFPIYKNICINYKSVSFLLDSCPAKQPIGCMLHV